MKKNILLLLLCFPVLCYSQFRSIQSEAIKTYEPYDSTYNIRYETDGYFRRYIGQKVKIINTPGGGGIRGFTKRPKRTFKFNDIRKFEGRSFTITDVIEEKRGTGNDYEYYYDDRRILKLVDNNNGEVWYMDAINIDDNNPFLVEAYYERLQDRFIGNLFYYVSNMGHPYGILKDMQTGEKISATGMDTKWFFKEIIIDYTPEYSWKYLCAVLVDENGREAMTSIIDVTDMRFFINVDHHRILYGTGQDAKDIAAGKVKIGWTKNQCISSWGMPKSTNTTMVDGVKHEQLVYDEGYLYFENGILTAIQQ